MGQTCSNVQFQTSRNLFLQDINNDRKVSTAMTIVSAQLSQQLQKQYKKFKQITYLPQKQQIIYLFNDSQQTVHHLQARKISLYQRFQYFQILEYITSKLFVVKIKYHETKAYKYKLMSIFSIENTASKQFIDFSIYYFNFDQLKHITQINKSLIVADSCEINTSIYHQQQRVDFIIQSQQFQSRIISLKELGFFMKRNDISWKDNQFLLVIQKCCSSLKQLHSQGFFMFQNFFIDKSSEVFCIGGLIGNITFSKQNVRKDFYLLVIYLFQTLFGGQIKITSRQELLALIEIYQKDSKFQHTSSIQILLKIYDQGYSSKTEQFFVDKLKNPIQSHIDHYIGSYIAKHTLQSSMDLGQKYIQLGIYFKAKQILFQKLSLLLYQQKFQKTQNKRVTKFPFKSLNKNKKFKLSNIQESFFLLQKIILLQRRTEQQGQLSQLQEIVKEYINITITFAISLLKKGNYIKSLIILERAVKFIHEEQQTWLLCLYLGQLYFLCGNLQDAQKYFKKSIQIEITQVNLCFFIMFYTSVLNWQKAISLIKSYQALITQEYTYQLLISKTLLAKTLCYSTKAQKQQKEKKYNFQACFNIIKRVFDRKNVPEIILMHSYQVLGDCNFYLMDYDQARKAYQKCLILVKSLNYKNKVDIDTQSMQIYQPSLVRTNQQHLTKSLYPREYQSFFSNGTHTKSFQQTSFNIESIISSNNPKNYEFSYQLQKFFDIDKHSVILSSIGNAYFMKRMYNQALKSYEQARNQLSSNITLKDSIVGNIALCYIQLAKNQYSISQKKGKIKQGKQLLNHIISTIRSQNPAKLQNDINYKFLLHQMESVQ